MNRKNLQKVLNIYQSSWTFGILILAALVLGYLNFKDQLPTLSVSINPPQKPLLNASTSQLAPSSMPTLPPQSAAPRRPLPADLTVDEIQVMNPPSPDASKDEKDKHFQLVTKLAQDADVLDINKCSHPNPLIMKVKLGSQVKINNSDSVDHIIMLDQQRSYRLAPGKVTNLSIDFSYGPGAYGYICDGVPGVVGFFFVQR